MSNKIELLKKLKELSDRGIGGEKTNAEFMLNKMLKKHGLNIEDLEMEEKGWHIIKVTKAKELLFFQVVGSVSGRNVSYRDIKTGSKQINVSNSDFLEICAKFEFYWMEYKKQLNLFYKSFIHRNEIYPKTPINEEDKKPETDKEREERLEVLRMMSGIKKSSFLKQLTN